MKRSEINRALRDMESMLEKYRFALPPFCHYTPEDWQTKGHDLRHTFATLALQNGVDVKTVSSMLGHYDAGFTLRTYTHATRQKQDEAAQTMGSFMAQVM